MQENKQPRWKSWPTWLAVAGGIGIILDATGIFAKIGWDSQIFSTVVNAIGAILLAFGVVNNPTDPDHF